MKISAIVMLLAVTSPLVSALKGLKGDKVSLLAQKDQCQTNETLLYCVILKDCSPITIALIHTVQ